MYFYVVQHALNLIILLANIKVSLFVSKDLNNGGEHLQWHITFNRSAAEVQDE